MPYRANREIDLSKRISSNYIISSHHRRSGNPHKCIWSITFSEEVECFVQTINQTWIEGTEGWGVKIFEKKPQVVGVNDEGAELKIARFIDSSKTNVWHGYPADYMRKSKDRPNTRILKIWADNGYITKSSMLKIRLGHQCSL